MEISAILAVPSSKSAIASPADACQRGPESPVVLTQERPTEPDHVAASLENAPTSPPRRFYARHADGLAVLAVLVVSLASAAWFTRSFYYFQDDFIFIRQAQTSSLSLTYLRTSLFQHFSPVSRLLDYVLAHWFHSSVTAAHTIELVLLAASVLAFSWTIAELVGRHWWRHLLTLGFAESLAVVHLLGWWTATANILPATLFGLLTIAAFLRYRRVGNRRWIAISLLSYGVSLCTHEQSWLVVGYLILFDLLVLAPGGRFRGALVRLWREAWIWLGYGLLTVLAMINYFAFYYAPLKPRATVGELIRYIGVQFSQGFAPSAIGIRPLTTGWTNTAALIIDSLVFRRDCHGEHLPASECVACLDRVRHRVPGQFDHDWGQSRRLLRCRFRPAVVLRTGARIPVPSVRRSRVFP